MYMRSHAMQLQALAPVTRSSREMTPRAMLFLSVYSAAKRASVQY